MSVLYGTHVGSLACPREVSLQGGCPSVQQRQYVGVIGPGISEALLEVFESEGFERGPLRLANYAHFVELDVGDLPREDTLDDVGSIKAVHAVGAHHSLLSGQNPARLLVYQLSLTETDIKLGHEVTVAQQFVLDNGNQLR